jgi:hypothetical protein
MTRKALFLAESTLPLVMGCHFKGFLPEARARRTLLTLMLREPRFTRSATICMAVLLRLAERLNELTSADVTVFGRP